VNDAEKCWHLINEYVNSGAVRTDVTFLLITDPIRHAPRVRNAPKAVGLESEEGQPMLSGILPARQKTWRTALRERLGNDVFSGRGTKKG
jgi:hypothetical protein